MLKSRGSYLLCVLENLRTSMYFQAENEGEKPEDLNPVTACCSQSCCRRDRDNSKAKSSIVVRMVVQSNIHHF